MLCSTASDNKINLPQDTTRRKLQFNQLVDIDITLIINSTQWQNYSINFYPFIISVDLLPVITKISHAHSMSALKEMKFVNFIPWIFFLQNYSMISERETWIRATRQMNKVQCEKLYLQKIISYMRFNKMQVENLTPW